MAVELVQGTAKILDSGVETHGYVSGSGGNVRGQIESMRTVTLDVGGSIVHVKHKQPIVVVDGDQVVVAGVRKPNGINANAMANRTRSTRNNAPATLVIIAGVLMILLGLPLSLILLGLPLVAFGGYFLYVGLNMKKANALIDEALSRSPAVTKV